MCSFTLFVTLSKNAFPEDLRFYRNYKLVKHSKRLLTDNTTA